MKVLITGGAGFIGSHLADALLRRGDTVCVVDNYSTGRRDNLSSNPNLTVIEGTIADAALTASAFDRSRPQVVVHAAASYKDPDNWAEDCLTNVLGTVNVIKAAKQIGVRRLVYFQTSLCYGLRPIEQPITLKHPIMPEGSSYALSKTVAEQYIQLSGMEYISFRLANAYGPRNLSGPLPTFYQRLTSGKACFVVDTRRDFIYVDDLIDVVVPAIDGKGRSGPYHVSSGRDYAIEELFDETVKALGVKLDREVEVRPRNADDVSTILLDPSQTLRDFAWKTTTPLSAGVRKSIDWYKRHGINQTYTHLKPSDANK
ncbi:MAG: NAD-dependent epimerase/dehydratase family protein [Planctomycetota bacterium]|nr:NAD-dependent epimerase/dehydratase family protein [Planctomycetota bacterium]